ncbi:hypothetical protein ACA910_011521 [Epithemia clementina (nom. ined.)]
MEWSDLTDLPEEQPFEQALFVIVDPHHQHSPFSELLSSNGDIGDDECSSSEHSSILNETDAKIAQNRYPPAVGAVKATATEAVVVQHTKPKNNTKKRPKAATRHKCIKKQTASKCKYLKAGTHASTIVTRSSGAVQETNASRNHESQESSIMDEDEPSLATVTLSGDELDARENREVQSNNEVFPPKQEFKCSSEELNECRTSRDRDALLSFYDRLNELVHYKAEYGDCNVPQKYADNKKLGSWVNKIRRERKNLEKNKKSRLNSKRISHLDELGFDWGKNKGPERWDEHYQALVEFYAKHGHCNVPTRSYKPNVTLGRWISTLRDNYAKSLLSKTQIQRLNELKFCWQKNIKKKKSSPKKRNDDVDQKHVADDGSILDVENTASV